VAGPAHEPSRWDRAGLVREPDLPPLRPGDDGVDTADEVVRLVALVNRHIQATVTALRRESALPTTAWHLLFEIYNRPGMTLAELARAGELSKARTSVLVEGLRGEGYVEKRADPDDRRVVRIFTTDRMDRVWLWYEERYRAAVREIMAGIDAEERRALVAALHKMREAAQARGW